MISALKFYRLIRQMKQFDLAVQTHIPPYRLSLLENSKVEASADELLRLAQALDTSPEQLKKQINEEVVLCSR